MNGNNSKWVAIWGNAVSITENRPEGYSKDITLRYPIAIPFDGSRLRVTFDNYCGTEKIRITQATVYVDGNFYDLTFSGSQSVEIDQKCNVVSDELSVSVKKNDECFVSFYLGDYTQMRSSVYTQGPLSSGIYAMGNQTHTKDISIDIKRNISINYFISNVSVYTDCDARAVVCYGDSITAQDWPDYLYLRCMEAGNNTSVIRRATSGSRILREYSCITYESYGLMGKNRFNHEVPTDGCDTVIIQQGINDIIHPVGEDVNPFRPMSDLPTAEQLIDGLKWYIEQARNMNYRVYVGTLLPIKGWRTYAPFRDEIKDAYNEWIRTTDMIDGCIDFDKMVRDNNDIEAFLKVNDSGDHLHPSAQGYKVMADTAWDLLFKDI